MSLRELPPKQKVSRTRWRRLRFVPLIVLVVLVAVSAVTGSVVNRREAAIAAVTNAPAPVTPSSSATHALPTVCRPPIAEATKQPWINASTSAKSEAEWQTHAAELKQPYVQEKNGWYDWGDVQAANFSQAVGRRYLTVAEVARWHDYFAKVESELAAQGIPFYVVVTPAKWDVYPQELPDWAQNLRGSVPLDQLLAASPGLPILDLRAQLRAASVDNQTYSKTNSHWSSYGGYVGWKAVAACLSATDPELADAAVPPISGVSVTADENEFATFGVADPEPNWTNPDYVDPLKPVAVTVADGSTSVVLGDQPTDLGSLPATTTTKGAQTSASALVLRDSYGNALSVPLQQTFARTWQVRHNFDSTPDTQPDIAALATKYHPDVVILQIAERHLNFPPQP